MDLHISITQESTIGSNIVSAVVAVIVLHLALGLFIYKVKSPSRPSVSELTINIFQAYFDSSKKGIKSD